MGEIHELFVLPPCLVWFAGATPEILKNIVTRFSNNFRIYGTPPSPGVYNDTKFRVFKADGLATSTSTGIWMTMSTSAVGVPPVVRRRPASAEQLLTVT